MKDTMTPTMYRARQKRRRVQRLGDIAAALGISALIMSGVALTFLFLWAGFDPGLVDSWFR